MQQKCSWGTLIRWSWMQHWEVLVSPNHPVVVFCIWIAFIDDKKPQKTRLFKCTDTFFKCLFKLLENNFLWTNRWKIRWKMRWKITTSPRCQVYTPVLAVGERVVLKKRRFGHKSAGVQMCGCFCMHLVFLVLVAYVCCYAPISKACSFYLAYFLDIFRIHSCLSSLCLLFVFSLSSLCRKGVEWIAVIILTLGTFSFLYLQRLGLIASQTSQPNQVPNCRIPDSNR